MRITLMHNPKAGRGNHAKRGLMAALANAGHRAIYQSTKKSDYEKALKNLPTWCLPLAETARSEKSPTNLSIAVFR
jgi:hypothetical protein